MERHEIVDGNALDLLEDEDLMLRSAFGQIRAHRGSTVEDRAEYGDLAKSVVRHVAIREAALVNAAKVVESVPELRTVSERLARQSPVRRQAIDRVEKMSRGVQGINLNAGQEFDRELTALMQIVGAEIEWDLDEALPAVRRAIEQGGKVHELSDAHKVAHRAPTNLDPNGPRWYERAPFISRLITLYDRLRDFPRAARQH